MNISFLDDRLKTIILHLQCKIKQRNVSNFIEKVARKKIGRDMQHTSVSETIEEAAKIMHNLSTLDLKSKLQTKARRMIYY
jgi:seryl-tRNA(Sec) selenium transferase